MQRKGQTNPGLSTVKSLAQIKYKNGNTERSKPQTFTVTLEKTAFKSLKASENVKGKFEQRINSARS